LQNNEVTKKSSGKLIITLLLSDRNFTKHASSRSRRSSTKHASSRRSSTKHASSRSSTKHALHQDQEVRNT